MIRTTLQSVLCLCLSPLLVVQQTSQAPPFSASTPNAPEQSISQCAADARRGILILPMDMQVSLRLDQPLTSATAKPGDKIRYTLVDDLIVGGRVVVPAGTPAYSNVTHAEPSGAEHSGHLRFSDPILDPGHGQHIRLAARSKADRENDSNMAWSLASYTIFLAPLMVPALLIFGVEYATRRAHSAPNPQDITYPQGFLFHLFTRYKTRIREDSLPTQTPSNAIAPALNN
jgi:hypothetical protein